MHMKSGFSPILAAGFLSICLTAPSSAQQIVYADQGSNWNATTRNSYYTQDQGSRLMPLSWLQALKRPDGTSFLADGLTSAGQDFHSRVQRPIADLEEAYRSLADLAAVRRGNVALGALPSTALTLLPAAVGALRLAHPALKVRVV